MKKNTTSADDNNTGWLKITPPPEQINIFLNK